ncbi:hypothetical protein OSB04_014959 [Centaurea solstitialis]|uniref:PGG domain-containing protein n=1 Tax=Centaurea solstitialis TaxID=347529 RepID=A0AA38SZN8_9ASTR|nr:hypothetical protein OSB04_014959 [Centaurea solstitialis]
MASSSNPPLDDSEHIYLYASNVNVSNFISVKLSGINNYNLWKKQMLCLMETHNMCGIVDASFDSPRASNLKIKKQYDSLLKGWIFGSVCEDVLSTVIEISSAKDVWDELMKLFSNSTMCVHQEGKKGNTTNPKLWPPQPEAMATNFPALPTQRQFGDSVQSKPKAKEETIEKVAVSAEMETKGEDDVSNSIVKPSAEAETMTKEQKEEREKRIIRLIKAALKRSWLDVDSISLDEQKYLTYVIDRDKNTMLHLAVGLSDDNFVRYFLDCIPEGKEKEVLKMKNVDGSTALHVAAIVGNETAAKLLVQKNKELLRIADSDGKDPLDIAYSNMQFETFMYLFSEANECKTKEANSQDHDDRMRDDGKTEQENYQDPDDRMNDDGESKQAQKIPQDLDAHLTELGVNVLVTAISAKEYSIASKLLENFPILDKVEEEVLMALARNFPSGLNRWETLIYPPLDDIQERVNERTTMLKDVYEEFDCEYLLECFTSWTLLMELLVEVEVEVADSGYRLGMGISLGPSGNPAYPPRTGPGKTHKIGTEAGNTRFENTGGGWHGPRFCGGDALYCLSIDISFDIDVEPIKDIDKRQKEWREAKNVLVKVCDKIDDEHLHLYDRPILEAARRNVYQVVDEFLVRSPKAIQSKDKKSGYDIIQLAVIHRSEKIYNLLYQIPKHKCHYRTFKDPSGNNMLHIAGRLAPSYKLKRRTGAALQLQRELQWFEELKKLVFSTYITEENIFKETPETVFTREHENLVKEGEKWMKATAESCSITAALITTIVFAAAITVPGGSNQVTGLPLLTSDVAFIVFATSDAISLFTSTTSLLVFLSILTARFAEEDFLVRLPRRLIIGLCTLFISTTAMMVAFSATLFLVFCDKKPWMLGPICGLACFPIISFVCLQFPLIVDLFWSTYVPVFGNRYQSRFDAEKVQTYLANSHHSKLQQKLFGKDKAVVTTQTKEEGGSATPQRVQIT